MPEMSNYQRRIVERYYDQRDTIMLNKLQELVTDLYLADSDRRRDQLWKRVQAAMANLKVPPALAEHILARRDPQILARHIQDWLKTADNPGKP
ncbi:MAG: hypothetical protein JXB13_10240 [Phycisphaerae bacterium]|nr:hypothetical protein [Phycisphaerae bacterium]